MSLIKLLVLIAFCSLGYLMLKDTINNYLQRKTYSDKELRYFADQAGQRAADSNYDKVENGIHLRTGLHYDSNLQTIIASCTSCHSAKLITQNKATREGWSSMIRWMQATQGLPDLGANEPIILDYLAKYYAPKNTGRRKNIDMAEVVWYELGK